MTEEQGKWFSRVIPRYQEPQRFYHSEKHLCRVLAFLQRASQRHGYPHIPTPLFFAALYHDAVYEPQRSDNEVKSAEVCQQELMAASIHKEIRERTTELILSTRFHTPPDHRFDAISLLDADLWVLGSPPIDYRHYAAQIRAEYLHVPLESYRRGRAAVLVKFLERPVLYYGKGERIYQRERQARRNLHNEIEMLSRVR